MKLQTRIVKMSALMFIFSLVFSSQAFAGDESSTQMIENSSPSIQSIENYWTEERMENAISVDPVNDQDVKSFDYESEFGIAEELIGEHASEPYIPNSSIGSQAVVPSTAGKIFFSYQGRDFVCSGSAINSNSKNLVMTAAHCVHGGQGEGWHDNLAFAPAYYNGLSHYGLWVWETAITLNGWIHNSNFDFDQAFFTVRPREGRNLVNVVGGNGLSYNYGQAQRNVRIQGYPAAPPYNGQLPYSCYGDTHPVAFSNDAYMNCNFTGGASGGPWFLQMVNEDVGYVFAVSSRRSLSGTPRLFATPNHQAVRDMYNQIQ